MSNKLDVQKFRSDAFTSLSKTPWAGKEIARRYKSKLFSKEQLTSGIKIGESWEFSPDPSFVSRLEDGKSFLEWCKYFDAKDLFGQDAKGVGARECNILVKLLNADQPLSLQVHPTDADPFLKTNECGKPESWLVLHAEPGAGLFLGFNKAMEVEELRNSLLDGSKASECLEFVPVKAGDYFEIEPGVPHAIGPGVTLLEPQRILPGKSGKTYRMWDWGRKYDVHGNVDMLAGSSRELHIEESLRLLDLKKQVGKKFVDSTRRSAQRFASSNTLGGYVDVFPANQYYQLLFVKLDPLQEWIIESFDSEYAAFISLKALDGVELSCNGRQSPANLGSKVFFEGESGFIPSILFDKFCFRNLSTSKQTEFALVMPSSLREKKFVFKG